jgi:hypothetical protein
VASSVLTRWQCWLLTDGDVVTTHIGTLTDRRVRTSDHLVC